MSILRAQTQLTKAKERLLARQKTMMAAAEMLNDEIANIDKAIQALEPVPAAPAFLQKKA